MPVRSKRNRRRERKADLDAWEMFFSSGWDFFNELARIDVETNSVGLPSDEVAREAWARLGFEFLRTWQGDVPQRGHYAVRMFGEPSNASP